MRNYYSRSTRRHYAKFNIVKETRNDERYAGSSMTNYYTEERGEIRERWRPLLECKRSVGDRRCFALLRRCYALGMLIVNGIDLRSAYSCLRANPSSTWESKIMKLLKAPLDLSNYLPNDEPQGELQTVILNLYQLQMKEMKVINPLPEIIWREETDDYYWLPHQLNNFIYSEIHDEYVDGELLARLDKRNLRRIKKRKIEQDELQGANIMGASIMKEILTDRTEEEKAIIKDGKYSTQQIDAAKKIFEKLTATPEEEGDGKVLTAMREEEAR